MGYIGLIMFLIIFSSGKSFSLYVSLKGWNILSSMFASVHIVVAHPAYTHTEVRHIQLLLLLHLSNCQGANAYSSGRFFGIMSQDVIHLFIYFNYDAYLLIVFLTILLLKMFHERYLSLEKYLVHFCCYPYICSHDVI